MSIFILVSSILIAESAGVIGSVFTASSVRGWYLTLIKPSWNPPAWVFGPVWITLYALMGVASSIVWDKRGLPGAKFALWVYGVQLALNALWSILFFGLKSPLTAFIEIIILLLAIIVTTILFWNIDSRAGVLMLPYIAWVLFATFLNYHIWQLNS